MHVPVGGVDTLSCSHFSWLLGRIRTVSAKTMTLQSTFSRSVSFLMRSDPSIVGAHTNILLKSERIIYYLQLAVQVNSENDFTIFA